MCRSRPESGPQIPCVGNRTVRRIESGLSCDARGFVPVALTETGMPEAVVGVLSEVLPVACKNCVNYRS